MTWHEAVRLGRQLELDTSSHVAAAVSGWHWGFTHEANLLALIFESLAGEKDLYPRPWHKTPDEIEAHNARVRQVLAEARANAPRGRAQPITSGDIP